jgi:hypothetical protein
LRGYEKEGIVEQIRAAGGEIYAITSEPQRLAARAQDEWGLGFDCIGDPHQEISATCRERGWLRLFVNEKMGFLRGSATRFDPQHPKGYFQPGVLALSSSSRVLYRWRSTPTHKNIGGAMERPTAGHVWSRISRALEQPAYAPDAAHDDDPPLDSRGAPWPLFACLLIANGWFIRPRGFEQRDTGPTAPQRVAIAGLRILGFVGLWVAAFWWLPSLGVAVALALWAAWITPQFRFLNEEFQDVSTP